MRPIAMALLGELVEAAEDEAVDESDWPAWMTCVVVVCKACSACFAYQLDVDIHSSQR